MWVVVSIGNWEYVTRKSRTNVLNLLLQFYFPLSVMDKFLGESEKRCDEYFEAIKKITAGNVAVFVFMDEVTLKYSIILNNIP